MRALGLEATSGGTMAAAAGASIAQLVISGLALLLALLMAVGAREPGVQT